MKQKIKIALIGGTGKAGKYIVNHLLEEGFPVRLLLRYPEKFQIKNPLVEIVRGGAREYEAVHSVIRGCHAVISATGQPVGEPSIFSDATKNVMRAMNEFNIKRYLLLTGLNVDTPFDHKSVKTQAGTDWMKANYPKTTLDKQVEYNLLTESNLDWTLVRLPLIEQTDERKKVVVSLEDCPGDKISATDLAHFLVNQLSSDTYVKQAPFIANV